MQTLSLICVLSLTTDIWVINININDNINRIKKQEQQEKTSTLKRELLAKFKIKSNIENNNISEGNDYFNSIIKSSKN